MSNLRIIIDGRMFDQSGIGRYIRNLISQLQLIDKKNEYFILHLKEDYDKLDYQNNFHKVLADLHWYGISEQIKLPRLLNKIKPNLVHFPHFNVPFFFNGKFVVTIHDLIHQHFSMERVTTHGPIIYKAKQTGYKIIFKNALSRSSKIFVPSRFVKDQLVKDWQVSVEKIVLTPEAVDSSMLAAGITVKKDKKNKAPYIFYVGNAHPHKNVTGLIKAFLILKNKYQNLKLILAGHDHYFWQKMKQEFSHKDIIYTGYVSDKELIALYKNAEIFVMPSLEEGFGIPLLEAMAFSCPVVSSNAGSLPEIGSDAASYFDPSSPSDMAEKIAQVLDDQKLTRQLVEKGLKRYKEFSWERLARQTLEVYLKL